MFKDRKLNVNQYTEGQLQKKCERYLSAKAVQEALDAAAAAKAQEKSL